MLGLIWGHPWGLSETSPGAANLRKSSFQPNVANSYYPVLGDTLMASAGLSPPQKGLSRLSKFHTNETLLSPLLILRTMFGTS